MGISQIIPTPRSNFPIATENSLRFCCRRLFNVITELSNLLKIMYITLDHILNNGVHALKRVCNHCKNVISMFQISSLICSN